MPDRQAELRLLRKELEAIRQRVDRLESDPEAPDPEALDAHDEDVLLLSGLVRQGSRRFNFRHRGALTEALAADPESVASVYGALGNPFRVRILRLLLEGPLSSQQLQAELEVGAVGQLYHHLKELLVAGWLIQQKRGVYALRDQAPMLLLLALVMAPRLNPQGMVHDIG